VQTYVQPPVTMRAAPSSIDFGNLQVNDSINLYGVTSITISQASTFSVGIAVAVSSGLTQYRYYQLGNNNNTSGYLGLSAEL